MDSQSSSYEYILSRYKYNLHSKLEFYEINYLNFWQKQSNLAFLYLPKIPELRDTEEQNTGLEQTHNAGLFILLSLLSAPDTI